MIPILFDSSATTFLTQGIGALTETISCLVTEERNGVYELEMTYPMTGHLYSELENGKILYTTHEYGKPPDAFRIYSITKPLNGIVTIKAEHISYQLDNIPVSPMTSTSAADCIAKLQQNMEEANPFTFETDISKNYTWHLKYPISARGAFAGWEGSIIDAYGGELQWDLWNVKLCAARGQNRGFTIRYGINLVDIKQEENIGNVITSIYPYFYSPALESGEQDVLVTLPEKILDTTHTAEYPYRRTAVYDFSYRFTETPTVEELRAVAEQYINYDYVGIPVVSLSLKFSQLSKAHEYELLRNLETVQLCDTVNVLFEKLGINTTAKVTRIIWDALKDEYDSVTVGDVRSNLSRILRMNIENNKNNVKTVYSTIGNSVNYATAVLTGSTGGYMYTKLNSEGLPEEQYFMDSPDVSTARKVLRINKDGWGFSKNGVNGPYTLAAVLSDDDASGGHLVADLITAGTLDASKVTVENLDASNITTGTLSVSLIENGSITAGKLANALQTDITNGANAYARSTAYKGTSVTGATNAAKYVTSSGFDAEQLVAGATVTVHFNNANTKSDTALTLNVNNTGAKTIYVAGAASSSTNQLLWVAGSDITFTYDGNYWKVVDYPGTWQSDTCSTASGTAAKVASATGIVVFRGTRVTIPMTNANSTTSATLNVSSTGAKPIYYGSGTTRPTTANGYGWIAGTSPQFEFDGANWRILNNATLINGAHIITQTIEANQINVTNLSAFNADIAGWKIGTNALYKDVTLSSIDYQAGINAPASPASGTAAFYIQKTDNGTTTYPFYVNYSGKLYANNAEIAGKVTATSGNIAGWTISSTEFYKSSSVTAGTADQTQYQTYLYAPSSPTSSNYSIRVRHRSYDGSSYGSWVNDFYVSYGGKMYARNAEISGTITATAGKIGGFAIESNSIHTNNVNIDSNATNSVGLSSSTFTRTIGGTQRSNLKFAIGSNFGVTNTGVVYASNFVMNNGSITVGSNFSVDANGNVVANSFSSSSANITGGTININSSSSTYDTIRLWYGNNYSAMQSTCFVVSNDSNGCHAQYNGGGLFVVDNSTNTIYIDLTKGTNGGGLTLRNTSDKITVFIGYDSSKNGEVNLYDASGINRLWADKDGIRFYDASSNALSAFYADPSNNAVLLGSTTSSSYTYVSASGMAKYRAFVLVAARGGGRGAMASVFIPYELARTCTSSSYESWAYSAQNGNYYAKCYFNFTNNRVYICSSGDSDCTAKIYGIT